MMWTAELVLEYVIELLTVPARNAGHDVRDLAVNEQRRQPGWTAASAECCEPLCLGLLSNCQM